MGRRTVVAGRRAPGQLLARERAYMRIFELIVDVQCGVSGAGEAIDALLAEAEERAWPEVVRMALFAAFAATAHADHERVTALVARLLDRAEDDGAPTMVALALATRAGLDISVATPELAMTSDDDLARATVMLESSDGPLMERITAHNQCAQAYGARWLWELCDAQYATALELAPEPPADWARYVLPAIVFNRAEMQVNWACLHRQVGELDMLGERLQTWRKVMSSSGVEGMPGAWVTELRALGMVLSALTGTDVSEQAREMLPRLQREEHPGAWPVGWLYLAIGLSDQRSGRLDSARTAIELAVSEIDPIGSSDPYDLALYIAAELEEERAPAGVRYGRRELAQRWSRRLAWHSSMVGRIQAERLRREHDFVTQQAHLDDLTALLNRRGLNRHIGSLAARDPGPVSLLVADLDHFKSVNDRYGHQVGDAVLVSVARMLHSHVRQSDCAVRLGGDEFALVLVSTGADVARRRAEALVTAVREHCWEDLAPGLAITISVGLASGTAAEFSSLVEGADRALYQAKRRGRNTVVCDLGWLTSTGLQEPATLSVD
jgi:diguanylate cyclase (GGDEF)-like protein